MNIKNYTTEVAAAKSIENIDRLLVGFGARNIMREYNDQQKCISISFIMEMNGMKMPFKLPPKVKNCYVWLKKKKPTLKDSSLLEQAERIAWKQMYEWVFLQLSMIELDQFEKLEAFFPYLYDVESNNTYYEKLKQGKFIGLLPASKP